jgi:site-specific recombinase XerD
MSKLAPTLQAFFTDRLIHQRDASPNTVKAYRDTFRLLLRYVEDQTGTQPSQLDLADIDAPLIGAFLTHLEHDRGNSPRTRNARLAAIHSLCRYAALRHPCSASLQHVDIATIALWLGHESIKTTYIYQHANNTLKQEAIDRTAPIDTPPGRYQPPDTLLAFLDSLTIIPTTQQAQPPTMRRKTRRQPAKSG